MGSSTVALRLRGLTHRDGAFTDLDLDVEEGEIVAFAGVEGCGAREIVRAVAGFERTTGTVEVDGAHGQATLAERVAFVPADRLESLFTNLSVGENVVSRLGAEISGTAGALRHGRMDAIARDLRERFRIKADDLDTPVRSLSGGNQQKVAIAAAVVRTPRVLVLEEPTRGVDVGSKAEIYAILREYASRGHVVVLMCTELPEVFEAADVLYVVSRGRLSAPLAVAAYRNVEALADEFTRLETHGGEPVLAGSPPPQEVTGA
jgi:ABC-type sugar transport system ATPase subunit